MTTDALARLQDLLRELFQFENAELDFGIYRIMNHKRREVRRFVDEGLPRIVDEALAGGAVARQAERAEELRRTTEQVKETFGEYAVDSKGGLNENFRETPLGKQYLELRAAAGGVADLEELKATIFNHVYTFFNRYYDNGDFLSKKRYSRRQKYAVPYNGEEVHLHWANADQYYVKTGEYFSDYRYKAKNGATVHFDLTAADAEQNNVKGEKRFFVPLVKAASHDAQGRELTVPFEYRPLTAREKTAHGAGKAQERMLEEAAAALPARFAKDPGALAALEPAGDLARHLKRYARRNTSDFFVHKDLKGFLEGELDFYLKNEVLDVDDIEGWGPDRSESWFEVMRAVKRVGRGVIAFLAQIEDFQKTLFEKKKFVTDAGYCLTLDCVPQELYEAVAASEPQREEWVRLFAIGGIKENITQPGYTEPLTVDFLEANPFLVLDTKHFDGDFTDRLLASIEDLDEQTGGLLVESENFQALGLLQERYREQVKCIYIDPPYNTGGDGFLYKDSYQHSSWLTMMEDRLSLAREQLNDTGIIFVSVDENELVYLGNLLSRTFSDADHVETIVWNKRVPKNDKGIGNIHEYIFVFAKDAGLRRSKGLRFQVYKTGIEKIQELISAARSRKWSPKKTTEELRKLYEKEAFDRGITLYNEVGDNYRIWGKINLNWPSPRSEGPKYKLLHPVTEKPVRIPKRGWRWKRETLEQHLEEEIRPLEDGSFVSGSIWFGADERTQPSFIQYLDDVEFQLLRSIVSLKSSGSLDLEGLGLESGALYPKPVSLIAELVFSEGHSNATVLDHFAGSGTTGHAVIDLNREDGGSRKYILVEMGEYFDTVLKPRILKVIYSKDWKDGKPVSREGTSHALKYLKLESYEDALNNVAFTDEEAGQKALEVYGDDYLLRYMLDFETRGSDTLLNAAKLSAPFRYRLRLRGEDGGETRELPVDLPETFAYLLGMRVRSRKAYHDGERRYLVYRGSTPDREDVVAIWRDTEGWGEEDYARDAAFAAETGIAGNAEEVFVNGDSLIPGARPLDGVFKRRMLAGPAAG